MPELCISGVRIMDGFLLVALKVKGHELLVADGVWLLDNKDVTTYLEHRQQVNSWKEVDK